MARLKVSWAVNDALTGAPPEAQAYLDNGALGCAIAILFLVMAQAAGALVGARAAAGGRGTPTTTPDGPTATTPDQGPGTTGGDPDNTVPAGGGDPGSTAPDAESPDGPTVAGDGARFVAGPDGAILDLEGIVIAGPTATNPLGKVDYLLGNVINSPDSVGKGGFFRGVMGFDESNLENALRRHLLDNFAAAAVTDGGGHGLLGRLRVTGTMTGPSGKQIDVTTIWVLTPDGSTSLTTAYPTN